MIAPTEAFPLTWPEGWKRTEPFRRRRADFGKQVQISETYRGKGRLEVGDGLRRLLGALNRMNARQVIISSNLKVKADGLPYANQAKVLSDPGVAAYWTTDRGERRCMAIDRYDTVADNLAAIAGTLEALRAVERYGGATILDRAFTGFVALPAPLDTRTWRQVLGIRDDAGELTPGKLHLAYQLSRSAAHPDKGGSPSAFNAVQVAYDQAKRELGIA